MSASSRLMSVVVVLIALTACQPSVAELSNADADAVRATIETYRTTALARDWDAWGKTLATDVVYSPPNVAPMQSREAAVAWVKGFPTLTSLTITVTEVVGRGDLAYSHGTYAYDVTMPDGSKASEQGEHLSIHRRQPDGTWPFTRVLWHSNQSPPAPAPAAAKK